MRRVSENEHYALNKQLEALKDVLEDYNIRCTYWYIGYQDDSYFLVLAPPLGRTSPKIDLSTNSWSAVRELYYIQVGAELTLGHFDD